MSVNHCGRSGVIKRIFFFFFYDFPLHEGMLCVLIRIASLRQFDEANLISTHNIPLSDEY